MRTHRGPTSSDTLLVTFLGSAPGHLPFSWQGDVAAFVSCHVGLALGLCGAGIVGCGLLWCSGAWKAGTEWAQGWFPWESDTLGRASHSCLASLGRFRGRAWRSPSVGPLGGVVSVSPHLGSLTNTLSIYITLLGKRQELPKHARNPQSQTAVLHFITTQFGRWRCYEPRGDGESWEGEVSGLSEARPPPTRPGPGKEARELQAGCFSTPSSGSTGPGGGPR